MKSKYITVLLLIFTSCAQQKIDKPPVFPPKKMKKIQQTQKLPRLFNYINLGDLKKNEDSLYCLKIDNECNILDGKTKLYNYYQTSGDDNPTLVPYTHADGEFLEGKYQGVWRYYDKNKKVIKKEKWDNGKLVYRKEYK